MGHLVHVQGRGGGEEVVVEDLEETDLRRFNQTTRSLFRGCPQMLPRMMCLSSLDPSAPSRTTGRQGSPGSSSTLTGTLENPRVKALSLTRIPRLLNRPSSGSMARSSTLVDLSKLAWP